ncbi:hypothetical protein AB0E88_10215 [Streptomyces sp. NPDC028635]|uniref:hypothetical protein n=1 Tax=Streptomyces sp. NPDC028635 TaxID=3154800 RepID=UPI0033CCC2BD
MTTAGRALRRLSQAVPGLVLGGAAALVTGVLVGLPVDTTGLMHSGGYVFTAGLLLAVGLYGSTYAIDVEALRADLTGVLVAVTLGVVLKAALIAGTMLLFFRRPESLVLGMAVAQIDPLSVAALDREGRMSPRARSLLKAWASFDDPMTVLLTLYLAGYAYAAAGHSGTPRVASGGTGGYLTGLGLNAALLAAVVAVWCAGRWAARRVPATVVVRRAGGAGAVLLVVALLVLAAAQQLMLAVALAGLVVRSRTVGREVDRAVGGAFLAAFLALGLLLARGVSWVQGVVLGTAAFAAQALVALLVLPLFVRGLPRRDRIALGLAQQNGITAVLIALTLERDFPGTAGTVGPAVLTVNALYGAGRVLQDRGSRLPGLVDLRELAAATVRHSPYHREAVEPKTADERTAA